MAGERRLRAGAARVAARAGALSASTVARTKERWQAEYSEWQKCPIDEIVYLWLDKPCFVHGGGHGAVVW